MPAIFRGRTFHYLILLLAGLVLFVNNLGAAQSLGPG